MSAVRQNRKGLEELRQDWAWLDDMKAEDRPWLYFGLHRAYHSQVPPGRMLGLCRL